MLQAITIIIIAFLIAIDQLIKFAVLKHLEPIGSITVIDKEIGRAHV